MRTRPLPQRHAYDLSLFVETIQATLNRNKHKGNMAEMTSQEIIDKAKEEVAEVVYEIEYGDKPALLEREAADLAVCALAAFIKARGLNNG